MNELYGNYVVERSDEYLAHYGIKGMKWGVRKAIASGSSRKLGRAYKKAMRKLAKLEKRGASGAKYAKRAALLGAGAAAAGATAAVGTTGIGKGLRAVGQGVKNLGSGAQSVTRKAGQAIGKSKNAKLRALGGTLQRNQLGKVGDNAGRALNSAGKAVNDWGNKSTVLGVTVGNKARYIKGTNNKLLRYGAAGLGAGLAAGSAYNTYRAATAKKNRAKAEQWRSEMNKAFAGTSYANGYPQKKKRRR